MFYYYGLLSEINLDDDNDDDDDYEIGKLMQIPARVFICVSIFSFSYLCVFITVSQTPVSQGNGCVLPAVPVCLFNFRCTKMAGLNLCRQLLATYRNRTTGSKTVSYLGTDRALSILACCPYCSWFDAIGPKAKFNNMINTSCA